MSLRPKVTIHYVHITHMEKSCIRASIVPMQVVVSVVNFEPSYPIHLFPLAVAHFFRVL